MFPMAPLIPTSPPSQARAGETWQWDDDYADYPRSEGWVLTYELRGTDAITIAAALTAANGEGWRVTVPATTTSPYTADSYEFIAVLTGSGTYAGVVKHLPLPRLQILPNLVIAGAGDRISFAQAELKKAEEDIAAYRAGQPQSYMVDGTQVVRAPLKDLYALRLRLQTEIAQLRAPRQFGQQINHRFLRASA